MKQPPLSHHLFHKASPGAYSLLEIVVALAILAVLAVLALQGSGKTRETSDNVRCVGSLRMIGVAMQAYVNDHNGMLPGPLSGGQRLGYDQTYSDQFHIPRVLGGYLGLPPAKAKGQRQFPSQIACMAWLRKLDVNGEKLTTPGFITRSKKVNGETIRPFGKTEDVPPMRLLAIEERASFSALSDIDVLIAPTYAGSLSPRPVHGHHRNTLFLDWHVSAVPATED